MIYGKGHDQLDANGLGTVVHAVEARDINGRDAIVPDLEDRLIRATSLGVLRESIGVVRRVLVVESPSAEDAQTSVPGSLQSVLDIGLVLVDVSVSVARHWQWFGLHTPWKGK